MKEFRKLSVFMAKILSLAIVFVFGVVFLPLFGALVTWNMGIYFEFISYPTMILIGSVIGIFLCVYYIYSRTSN